MCRQPRSASSHANSISYTAREAHQVSMYPCDHSVFPYSPELKPEVERALTHTRAHSVSVWTCPKRQSARLAHVVQSVGKTRTLAKGRDQAFAGLKFVGHCCWRRLGFKAGLFQTHVRRPTSLACFQHRRNGSSPAVRALSKPGVLDLRLTSWQMT